MSNEKQASTTQPASAAPPSAPQCEQAGAAPSDADIDAVCAPERAKRWHGDGRQYDRDTVRLVLAAFSPTQQVREQAALPADAHEALTLAREYVVNASQRAYDGTNGQGILDEAKRRLALIDAALAQGTTPAAAYPGCNDPSKCPNCFRGPTCLAQTTVAGVGEQATCVGGKYADVLTPFVAAMEAELHANSAKGDRPGWLTMSREVALLEIYWHTAKLSAAVKKNDAALIREHSADVANMAMMLLDVCGGLDVRAAPPSAPQAAGAVPMEWKKAVQEAYGWLWHVNNEPTAPVPMWAPEKAAYEARKNLRDLLTKEERAEAINAVGGMLENKARAIAQSTPPAMSDERIESMLSDLDQYAREVDIYDYGLPSICDHPRLFEIVREFLAEAGIKEKT